MAAASKFNSVVTNPGGTGSTITPTLSTHAAGDVIEIFVSKTGNASWSAPANWTIRHQTTSPGTASTATVGTLLYRRVLPGDTLPLASPVCTLGATVTRHAIARTVRGADVEGVYVLPEWGATGSASGTNNPIRPPSVTTLAPEIFVTHYYCQRVATNAPEPTGYTQDQQVITSGTLVTNISERTVADQATVLSNQDVSPTSGGRWVGMISCVPSPDYAYYRSGSSAFQANALNAAPALPAGTSSSDNRSNKDLIVATIECAGTPTVAPNTPADWTEITEWSNTTSGNGTTVRKYRALYDGTLDRQFNRSTSGEIFVYFSVYRNAHQSFPLSGATVQQNASSTSGTWPALVRTSTKATIQLTCVADATPTYTTPSPWIERNDSQGVVCGDQSFNATGTVASGSFTLNSASPTLCGVLEVNSVASAIVVAVIPAIATLTLATFVPVIDAQSETIVTPSPASLVTATFAPLPVMTGSLVDDFNDNSRDTSKWTLGSIAFNNAGVGVAEANQQVEITPLSNEASPAIYGYKSVDNWNFTGRQAVIRIAATIGIGTEAWLVVAMDVNNYVRTWVAGGNIQTRSRVASINSSQDHGAFSLATHTYWRIRHDVGPDEIVWEYSADESTWNELRRLVRGFAITSVSFYLSGGTGSSVSSPALVKFDDFNHGVPSEAVTATPTAATLTLAAFAPKLIYTTTPAIATLSLSTFVPALSLQVTSNVTSLTLVTFAPSITFTSNVTAVPSVASLAIETFAASLRVDVVPAAPSLTLTVFAPSVLTPVAVIPQVALLLLTGFAPTISAPVTVTPSTASLTIQRFAPGLNESVIPSAANLIAATFAASLRIDVTPDTQSLTLIGFAPSLSLTVGPSTAPLLLNTFAPTVAAILPDTATLTLTTFVPLVNVGNSVTVEPPVASLSVTAFASSLSLRTEPATQTLILQTFAPSVTVLVTVQPGTAALTLGSFEPSLLITLTPAVQSLSLQFFAPLVLTPVVATPATSTLTLLTFPPSLNAMGITTVVPATVNLTLTTYAPALRQHRTPPRRTFVIESERRTTIVQREMRVYLVGDEDREEVLHDCLAV